MAIVHVETRLEAPAEIVWATVQRYDTLRHVMAGLIRFSGKMPEHVNTNDRVEIRLWFFHLIPTWKHVITIEKVSNVERIIQSRECGGFVRTWNHRILVSETSDGATHYADEIEIDAGHWTPLVCAWAHLQYRYRQSRWRRLASQLAQDKGVRK